MIRRLLTFVSAISLVLLAAVLIEWGRQRTAGAGVEFDLPSHVRPLRPEEAGAGPWSATLWHLDLAGFRVLHEVHILYRDEPELLAKGRWIRNGNGIVGTTIRVPYWAIGFALAVVCAWCGVHARKLSERVRRAARGACTCCGYDVRASKNRCPECGTPIPIRMSE